MAAEFKTKASQRTNMGKSSEAYKSTIGVKGLVLIPPEVLPPIPITIYVITNGSHDPTPDIIIGGASYFDGEDTDGDLTAGNYSLTWNPNGETGLTFINWTVTGGVSVVNPTVSSTTLHIAGTGTLTLNLSAPLCPAGEQIANGGFETNSGGGTVFLPWTHDNNTVVRNTYAHSGSYSAWLTALSPASYVDQVLATPTPVSCIKSSSLWIFSPDGTPPIRVTALFTYTDSTTSSHEFVDPTGTWEGGWAQLNLLSYLTPGKTLQEVRFTNTSEYNAIFIDDVSVMC